MLRPASLLSTKWTFDAPLWPVTSLPSAGACYRALRRLPGQDLHLLEERVFQDAPWRTFTHKIGVSTDSAKFMSVEAMFLFTAPMLTTQRPSASSTRI